MANDNKKAGQDRRKVMNRTSTRVVTVGKGELLQKKQQDRIARQEQKMMEKLERQANPQEKKNKPVAEKRVSQSGAGTAKTTSATRRDRQGFWEQWKSSEWWKTLKKKGGTKENGFQIIIGGRSKKLLRVLGVVALIAVVAVIINSMVPISITEYMKNMFAGAGSGEGFPVAISSSGSHNLISVGSDVALLGDSSLYLYKSNGKLLFERQHGFADPAVTACSARVMVYDRGGKGLRIENRAETLYSLDLTDAITTACMADNGSFAVVTRGSNYISDVTVYNASAEEKFVWHSANRQVMGVSLSDNGRYLAIHTFGVEGAQGVTDVILYDTKNNALLTEKTFPGSTPISLDFKGSTVLAVMSDRVAAVTKGGESKEYLFEGGTLTCFDNANEFGAVLVLGMYQNNRDNRLVVLDEDLEVMGQAELLEEITAVSAKGRKIHLLADQKVLFMTRYGGSDGEAVLQSDVKTLLCKGNRAIVLGTDTLDELYAD